MDPAILSVFFHTGEKNRRIRVHDAQVKNTLAVGGEGKHRQIPERGKVATQKCLCETRTRRDPSWCYKVCALPRDTACVTMKAAAQDVFN